MLAELTCTELCGCNEECQHVSENVHMADALGIDDESEDESNDEVTFRNI